MKKPKTDNSAKANRNGKGKRRTPKGIILLDGVRVEPLPKR